MRLVLFLLHAEVKILIISPKEGAHDGLLPNVGRLKLC